jgi:hypothetical protein
MMMAGVVPMNWLAVASEWQRDWARQDSAKALGEMVLLRRAPRAPHSHGNAASRSEGRRRGVAWRPNPRQTVKSFGARHDPEHYSGNASSAKAELAALMDRIGFVGIDPGRCRLAASLRISLVAIAEPESG